MAEEPSADETPITFHIKSSADAKYDLTMPLSATVLDLKTKLATAEYADIPPERQRLIYSGRVMKDPDTLASNKVKEGHTIHLVRGAASNQRQNPANAPASTSTTTPGAAPGPAPTGAPTNLATGTGNNPLAGLTGARYAGFAQLPNASLFGPDGGMGPPPDPDQVIRMMQNPQFASTINEALSNPQILDMMIQQNPMLRDMPGARQMMQSPEFRQMLTNPESLRQMAQMRSWMDGLGMGVGGAPGAGGGNDVFPAPGVTDTTPESQRGNAGPQPPPNAAPANPFAMFGGGDPFGGGAAGAQANPFAALFPPSATTTTPATSTPPPTTTAGQNTPSTTNPPTSSTDANANATPPLAPPIANMFNNPFLQNAAMQQMLAAMNPQNAQWPPAADAPPPPPPSSSTDSNHPTAGTPGQAQPPANPLAALFGPGGPMAGGMGGGGGMPPWMQGLGGAGATPQAPADTRPPEVRYEEQLRQLNAMGFYEFERNVEALRRMGGSVEGAVEWLLRG